MTKNQLKELEEWCVFNGYKKECRRPIANEDWRWSKASDKKDFDGNCLYTSSFLVYDYTKYANCIFGFPYSVIHYVIAKDMDGREYHLSHSIDWGKANLDDTEILAAKFYEFIKEKV